MAPDCVSQATGLRLQGMAHGQHQIDMHRDLPPGLKRGPACAKRGKRIGGTALWTLILEVEQVKQVANSRPVGRNIFADRSVVRRVWQVIAAAPGDRRQAPVVFDEL